MKPSLYPHFQCRGGPRRDDHLWPFSALGGIRPVVYGGSFAPPNAFLSSPFTRDRSDWQSTLEERHAIEKQFVIVGTLCDCVAVPFTKPARVIFVEETLDFLLQGRSVCWLTCKFDKQGKEVQQILVRIRTYLLPENLDGAPSSIQPFARITVWLPGSSL